MISIVGTAEGEVEFFPADSPAPEPVAGPEGWKLDLGNARFEQLENFEPSIQVVSLLVSERADSLHMWMTGTEGTIFHWWAGPAEPYSGTLCFQLALTDDGEALPLEPATTYTLTLALLDADGQPVVSQSVAVAGRVPALAGDPPTSDTRIVRMALACPRAPL